MVFVAHDWALHFFGVVRQHGTTSAVDQGSVTRRRHELRRIAFALYVDRR